MSCRNCHLNHTNLNKCPLINLKLNEGTIIICKLIVAFQAPSYIMASEGTYKCTLSEELQKKATKELNEKAKYRTRDIQFLRERVLANKGMRQFYFLAGFWQIF